MHQTKYRAWQPHRSLHRQPGMYQVSGLEFYPKHGGGEAFLAQPGEEALSSEYFEDIKLMRYTGLSDKKGVHIFEGDIIEFPAHDRPFSSKAKEKTKRSVVYWFDGKSKSDPKLNPKMLENPSWFNQEPGFQTRELEHDGFFAQAWSDFHNCEVVGNIYQHPGLLKAAA